VSQVFVVLDQCVKKLENRLLVLVITCIARDLQESRGPSKTFIMTTKHNDSEISAGLPITLDALEYIQTSRDGLTTDV
jgi:hypothetical protein